MHLSGIPEPLPLGEAVDRLVESLRKLGGAGDLRESCLGTVRACLRDSKRRDSLDTVCRQLTALEAIVEFADDSAAITVSLWLRCSAPNDEPQEAVEESRSFAHGFLLATGIAEKEDIYGHVMSLVTLVPGFVSAQSEPDHRVMADVLHLELGLAEQDYLAHEHALRTRYPLLDDDEWAAHRYVELKPLSLHTRVFFTLPFIAAYEQNARANIRSALRRFDITRMIA